MKGIFMLFNLTKRLTLVMFALFLVNIVLADGHGKIKIGILHSLSGTMVISETTLKDTM